MKPPSDATEADDPAYGSNPTPKTRGAAGRTSIFVGRSRWVHFLYLGVFALGILGFLVPAGSRALALLGGLGAGGVLLFMNRAGAALIDEGSGEAAAGIFKLDWEIGAYAAIAGFAGLLLMGLGGVRTSPSSGEARDPVG
jgi:hypothetical protein